MNGRTIRICVGIAFLALAVVVSAWSAWRHQRLVANGPAWPTVEGTISESKIRPCSKNPKYAPEVRYTYGVHGTSYDGEVLFKSDHCGAMQDAQAIVDAYPVTFTFPVHVDPEDPSTSLVLAP